MEKPTVRHPQQQPQQQQHHQQQHHQQHQIQQHQQHLQLLHQQQQHQHQQHQRKVDEVEVTSSAFICRFMDLPGVITLQKLPGCVKLDNQTINCTSLQQQIEMTRQFILEYDRIKSAGNKYQQVR
eukprot:NODE_754_length_4537_cov_0.586525.p4 type:complete len:125 gc:universal NODE_754_length_4537_cov_0.586525:3216-2842(-)